MTECASAEEASAAAIDPPSSSAVVASDGGGFQPQAPSHLALLGDFSDYIQEATDVVTLCCGDGSGDDSEELGQFSVHRVVRFGSSCPPHTADASPADGRLPPFWDPTVHVFDLRGEVAAPLNDALWEEIRGLPDSESGLSISNVGGFHSEQQLFRRATPALSQLEAIVSEAVSQASSAEAPPSDSSDSEASSGRPPTAAHGGGSFAAHTGRDSGHRPRKRPRPALAAQEEGRPALPFIPGESWANICGPGAFHALHDHEGALFSGVYYVRVPEAATGGGELLLRTAVGRRGPVVQHGGGGRSVEGTWCRYMPVAPVPGRLVLFPGWLPHCVTPVAADAERGGGAAASSSSAGATPQKEECRRRVNKDLGASARSPAAGPGGSRVRVSISFNVGAD